MHTAGLGLYEYMLLSEELGAEPIWVINNGLRHAHVFPALQPHVTSAPAWSMTAQPAGGRSDSSVHAARDVTCDGRVWVCAATRRVCRHRRSSPWCGTRWTPSSSSQVCAERCVCAFYACGMTVLHSSRRCVTGAPDSRWGSLRARMGRVEPWALTYMGIGNEVSALLALADAHA